VGRVPTGLRPAGECQVAVLQSDVEAPKEASPLAVEAATGTSAAVVAPLAPPPPGDPTRGRRRRHPRPKTPARRNRASTGRLADSKRRYGVQRTSSCLLVTTLRRGGRRTHALGFGGCVGVSVVRGSSIRPFAGGAFYYGTSPAPDRCLHHPRTQFCAGPSGLFSPLEERGTALCPFPPSPKRLSTASPPRGHRPDCSRSSEERAWVQHVHDIPSLLASTLVAAQAAPFRPPAQNRFAPPPPPPPATDFPHLRTSTTALDTGVFSAPTPSSQLFRSLLPSVHG